MRVIRFLIAIAAASGCGAKANEPTTAPKRAAVELPTIDDDHAVAELAKMPKPSAVVWIDRAGKVEISRIDGAWTGALPTGARTSGVEALEVVGQPTLTTVGDDPPPPPEEDVPDDDSGGTGTAMALDEGKMGKPDSDRAEGQYKMKNDQLDPQLARQQAIEEAQAAGILGDINDHGSTVAQRRGEPSLPSLPIAKLRAEHAVVVAAAPSAPAIQVARILAQTSGAIAVFHRGKVAVLSRGYGIARDTDVFVEPASWIELHVSADGVHVVETSRHDQTVLAWKQGGVDRDALRATYLKLEAERFGNEPPNLEIRVGDGVTAQQLVDLLVALDDMGAVQTSIGELFGTTDARLAQLAQQAKPHVASGQPSSNGDLDKALIRKPVKDNIAKIEVCYETALATKPTLGGTVYVQFFIDPSGAVAVADASGVDPDLARCVAGVVKGLAFPKPRGGGVQVSYPFTFHPTTP